MKVIVKDTGEIIEAEYERQSGFAGYRNKKTEYWYYDSQIKAYNDIDWEERRYELAKAAMQGYCANSLEYVVSSANHENIAEWSVSTADAVIKQLKGGKE